MPCFARVTGGDLCAYRDLLTTGSYFLRRASWGAAVLRPYKAVGSLAGRTFC
jgi:hypothetical protein